MTTPLINASPSEAASALAHNSKATSVLLVEDNDSDALLVLSADQLVMMIIEDHSCWLRC